ncbi:hypothetical protein B7P43_G03336, partial [Cryptotermes secundus]
KEVECKEKYRIEILKRFAALKNVEAEVDINRTWETIREYIKISAKETRGYYELKTHKPRFNKRFSQLLYIKGRSQTAVVTGSKGHKWDNLNNIRREASRISGKKRGEFRRGHQPKSNLVKDENGDLLADSHNTLNRWKNYFPV